MKDLFALSAYDYALPEELIAQRPCTPRDRSRLMLVDRSSGKITEMVFSDLVDFLQSGDQLVFNDTKVIPARLFGKRESGGSAELLLTRRLPDETWEAIGRPLNKMRVGTRIVFSPTFSCEVIETMPNGSKRLRFQADGNFDEQLAQHGQIPLPHYIDREVDALDPERYQTVYASSPGAIAAPTAGLHFTQEMLEALAAKGVSQEKITLHVGIGTFRPVQVDDIRNHVMHAEQIRINLGAAQRLSEPMRSSNRRICVGTTTCRALETVAGSDRTIPAGDFESRLFVYPGYQMRYAEALLTNFHLPGSSLLMLVCAFAGYELMMEAYARAVRERYRFFSYGDAMLIV